MDETPTKLFESLTSKKDRKRDLINKFSRNEARKLYNDSENWDKFANRMQKNEFMKSTVYGYYGGTCARCKDDLDSHFVLHHRDYLHECGYDKNICFKTPTKNYRIELLPDCENCSIHNGDSFNECLKRIVPVHRYCNKIFSLAVKRQSMRLKRLVNASNKSLGVGLDADALKLFRQIKPGISLSMAKINEKFGWKYDYTINVILRLKHRFRGCFDIRDKQLIRFR